MQNAVQFIATKKDNRLIEIPEEFVDAISGQFQVILLLNKDQENKPRVREFNAFKINTISSL